MIFEQAKIVEEYYVILQVNKRRSSKSLMNNPTVFVKIYHRDVIFNVVIGIAVQQYIYRRSTMIYGFYFDTTKKIYDIYCF